MKVTCHPLIINKISGCKMILVSNINRCRLVLNTPWHLAVKEEKLYMCTNILDWFNEILCNLFKHISDMYRDQKLTMTDMAL